jgi:biotin carboxyl carrier protein
MAVKNSGNTLLHLRTLFNVGAIGALTDGQLLIAAAVAAASGGGAARAAVPAGLADSTIVYAGTASAVPTSVAVITEGVLASMFLSKIKIVMTAAAVVAALAAGAVALAQSGIGRPAERQDQEHRKIVLTSSKAMDVTVTQRYVCQIHSQRRMNVRVPENGYLSKINVREGQAVKKGDRMFKIVPIRNNAKLNADQVDVTAPFDGIIDRLMQPGSLLKEGDILTTLSDNSVMRIYFNVPEKQYLEYMANLPQHKGDTIELVLANQTKFEQPGKIGAIEGTFNKGVGVGDRIVLEGIRQVHDGEKVELEFRPLEDVMRKPKNQSK